MSDSINIVPTDGRVGSFSEEQLKERRLTLGASEIPAVCGLSKYGNALTVWLEKMGRPVPRNPEAEQPSKWGLILEPAIAQRYADEHGVTLIQGEKRIHTIEQWMSATPDRLVVKDWGQQFIDRTSIDRGLELKNRNAHVAHQFGESGTDIVPLDIAAQCHWSMIVTGLDVWDIAVLIGGNDWRWYRLHRDDDIAADMQQQGYDFWHNYVLPKKEPPIDGSEVWTEHITRLFKKHTEVILDATPDDVQLVKRHRALKDEEKMLKMQVNLVENEIKARIADAVGFRAPDGTQATWRLSKDSEGVDYQAVSFELAVRLGLSMEEQRELAAKHTVVTKAGSRRLLTSLPKEK